MEIGFRFAVSLFGKVRGLALFIHNIVDGFELMLFQKRVQLVELFIRIQHTSFQCLHEHIRTRIHLGGRIAHAGNNQRRTRLINEDGVDFVDDGIVQFALYYAGFIDGHVVTQIVETELVVGTIGDVGIVGMLTFFLFHGLQNHSHVKTQELVYFSHPFGVALCQVVVNGNDVHTFPCQRIQIRRHRSHQRFTFTGLHLGNAALMQNDSTDDLNGVRFHAQHSPCRLTHRGKRLRQQRIQRLSTLIALLVLLRFRPQIAVREFFHLRFQCQHRVHLRTYFIDFLFTEGFS